MQELETQTGERLREPESKGTLLRDAVQAYLTELELKVPSRNREHCLQIPALVFENGETYNCPQRTSCALWVKCSEDLTLADQDMHWVLAPGTLDITIGYGYPSADVALKGALEVK